MVVLAEKPLPEMIERLVFSTDIQKPFSGEYRFWRREPRTQLVYTFRLSDERFAALEETIKDNRTAFDWTVPFWHERTRNLDLTIGQTVLPVDTNADYRAGGTAMIWKGCDEYETATIDSVGSGTITLSSGLGASYENAAVMPAHLCFMSAPVNLSREFRGRMEVQMTFQLVTTSDLGATVWTEYESYEVLSCASGYLSKLDGVVDMNVEYFATEFGAVTMETTQSLTDTTFAAEMSDEAWNAKRFLHKVRGMDYPFWMKAWGGQLEVQAASSGASTIIVGTSRSASDLTNRHIFIDGQYRQITSVADGATTQTLTLNSVLTSDVAEGAPVALLSRVRLAADAIDIEHIHGFSSRVSFPVMEDRAA